MNAHTELKLSDFGERLSRSDTGTVQLLEGMSKALLEPGRINLGMGAPPRPSPIPSIIKRAEIKTVHKTKHVDRHRYGRPEGWLPFLEIYARDVNEMFGCELEPEKNFAAFHGSSFTNSLILNTFTGPYRDFGLKAIINMPEYLGYQGQFLGGSENCVFSLYQKMRETGHNFFVFEPDLKKFRETLENPEIYLFVISNPNNPSTNVLTHEMLEKMVSDVVKMGKVALLDEAYGKPHPDLVYKNSSYEPILGKRVVIVNSASKCCMEGDRLSVGYSEDTEIMDVLKREITNSAFHAPKPPQALFKTLIESGDIIRIENHLREYCKRNLERAVRRFKKECKNSGSVLIHENQSSFYILMYPTDLPKEVTSHDVYKSLLADYGTIIVEGSGSFYGIPVNERSKELGYDALDLRRKCFRITVSPRPKILDQGMINVAQCLDGFYGTNA